MHLAEYLAQQGESEAAFAKRSGVPRSTINSICNGGGTRVETGAKIVAATGGLVGFMDLIPDGEAPDEATSAA